MIFTYGGLFVIGNDGILYSWVDDITGIKDLISDWYFACSELVSGNGDRISDGLCEGIIFRNVDGSIEVVSDGFLNNDMESISGRFSYSTKDGTTERNLVFFNGKIIKWIYR